FDRSLDEDRLIEQRHDFQRTGDSGQHFRKENPDALDNVQGGGAAILEHAEESSAFAILANNVILNGKSAVHRRNITDKDGDAIDFLDRDGIEGLQDLFAAV